MYQHGTICDLLALLYHICSRGITLTLIQVGATILKNPLVIIVLTMVQVILWLQKNPVFTLAGGSDERAQT